LNDSFVNKGVFCFTNASHFYTILDVRTCV